MRGEASAGRREAAGDRGARSMQRWALGAGHGEKRTTNIWTMPVYPPVYVTLEVSKLSGWLNADARCRVARRACDAEQGEAREAAGLAARVACTGRARLKAGGFGTRGAYRKHVAHICDAGGVEAQRLVERRRVLPRVEKGAHGAWRGAARETGGRRTTAAHAACRRGRDCRLGAGHAEERTENIWCMVVTLEVSKLTGWLNADPNWPCRELKGGHTVRGEAAGQQTGATASSVQGRARLRIGCRAR